MSIDFMKGALLAFTMSVGIFLSLSIVDAFPLSPANDTIQQALEYLNSSQEDDGSFGTFGNTVLATMAIRASNQDPNSWKKNNNSPIDYLNSTIIPNFNSTSNSTNRYATLILALAAANLNPQNISGRDLTAELLSKQNPDGSFNDSTVPGWFEWITDEIWAALALSLTHNNSIQLNNTIDYIKSQQDSSGCFASFCSADDTALGIMALIASGENSSSSNISNALSKLKTFQTSDAGFKFSEFDTESNVDSTAWSILAIIASGNNFTDFLKSNFSVTTNSFTAFANVNLTIPINLTNFGNNNPYETLLMMQSPDGSFTFFSPVQDTSYAIKALLGKPYPITTNYNQLESIGIFSNQTFNISISQTKNWTFIFNSTVMLNASESIGIPLMISVPANAAGEENNITISVTSLTDGLQQSKNIIISVQSLCGNSVCEEGESCSSCSQDCGSCPPPDGGNGGGGGGGGSGTGFSHWGTLTTEGITKEIVVGKKAKFKIGGSTHTLVVSEVDTTTAVIEINSTPLTLFLALGETGKIDFDDNDFYDLAITLDEIIGSKATVTLKTIFERYVCPACPQPSDWSECSDNLQTRTNYQCDGTTDFECVLTIESEFCESEETNESVGIEPQSGSSPFTGLIILQNSYLPVIAIIIIGAVLFVFWRRKPKQSPRYQFKPRE